MEEAGPGMGETGHGGGGRQPGKRRFRARVSLGERAVYTEWGRPRGALEILMPGRGTLMFNPILKVQEM